MKALLDLENSLAEVLTVDDLAGAVLTHMVKVAGASGSMVFSFDRDGIPTIRGGSVEPAMVSYTPDLFPEDYFQRYSAGTPPGTFLTTDRGDFDLRGHLRSRPFADFYSPNDLGYGMGVWPTGLPFGAEGMFGVVLYTPRIDQPFSDEVRGMLTSIEAPMRAAARRIARFGAMARARDVLGHLVNSMRGAFVLWDQDTQPVWASAAAAEVLEGPVPGEDLGRAAAVASRQLRRPERLPLGVSVVGRPQRLRAARGGAVMTEFSCVRMPDRTLWLLAELRALEGEPGRLATLTAAETRVLRLLSRGLSNEELARELFISRETVKTHVQRILGKLGVSSRAKAANLARDSGLSARR